MSCQNSRESCARVGRDVVTVTVPVHSRHSSLVVSRHHSSLVVSRDTEIIMRRTTKSVTIREVSSNTRASAVRQSAVRVF